MDTSVWVGFLCGHQTEPVHKLETLILQREDLCVCGVILTEVLQGIRVQKEFEQTRARLAGLLYLPMERSTFEGAASIYRSLRAKGVTIRNSVDCLIAAVALEQDIPLLQNDRDFDFIAQHFPLKTL